MVQETWYAACVAGGALTYRTALHRMHAYIWHIMGAATLFCHLRRREVRQRRMRHSFASIAMHESLLHSACLRTCCDTGRDRVAWVVLQHGAVLHEAYDQGRALAAHPSMHILSDEGYQQMAKKGNAAAQKTEAEADNEKQQALMNSKDQENGKDHPACAKGRPRPTHLQLAGAGLQAALAVEAK
eukprot:1134189-Pelagomonas_calceolata.AAC.2